MSEEVGCFLSVSRSLVVWFGHRLRRALRSRKTGGKAGGHRWRSLQRLMRHRAICSTPLASGLSLCLRLSQKTHFEKFTGHFLAVGIAATSQRYRESSRCAPVCSLLCSSRRQADRRAVRLYSCAPAVHAWHGRPDPWIHLSSQDKVRPIQNTKHKISLAQGMYSLTLKPRCAD